MIQWWHEKIWSFLGIFFFTFSTSCLSSCILCAHTSIYLMASVTLLVVWKKSLVRHGDMDGDGKKGELHNFFTLLLYSVCCVLSIYGAHCSQFCNRIGPCSFFFFFFRVKCHMKHFFSQCYEYDECDRKMESIALNCARHY